MKVLLVGSSSFIGERLLKFLVKEKYEIVCMARCRRPINCKIEFYEWNLGDLLIFDRTNLHCSSSNIKDKKIGLTTFTKK